MTTPFDLDALDTETTGEPFEFVFDGETYELPAHIDVRAAAALDGDRLDDGLRLLLGADQWERLQASPATFTREHLFALMEAYGAHSGIEPGNSSASSGSSTTRARPSKRTSSATTRSRSRVSSRES